MVVQGRQGGSGLYEARLMSIVAQKRLVNHSWWGHPVSRQTPSIKANREADGMIVGVTFLM
jgi:hypothetical protein